jgi:two-component system phosphate regulon sensor histidine kinase PhoR
MARKINLNFMMVIAVSIILSVLFTTIVSYRFFQKEVFAELSSFAEIMEDLDFMERMEDEGVVNPHDALRITWIAQNGSVLYDSYSGNDALDNHKGRPEVAQAMKKGEGTSVRKSETMGKNIFFYARRTADGTILRIAKEAGSIWNVYSNTLPITLLVAVLSFLISVWIARQLTKAFVSPIEQMASDMEHLQNVSTYKELMPFIELIRSRHQEALLNAKIRQEFTANVSHELKTPLTSISGYAELIATGMASKKEGRHFAEEIHGNAQRLLALINDILQLSELDDAPDDSLSFEPVDVYGLAARCVEMLQPIADKHGVTLSLKGTPLVIHADKSLLEELLYNLCDNAIRYNREGGHVWVTVTNQLIVQDDGIGISPKYQKRVFERFFRVDKSRSRKTGGTGLGLAIVKHIAEVHHADIFLDSDVGIGTTIRVLFADNEALIPTVQTAQPQ